VHSTPEPGSERDLLVPLKVDGNNETPEPSCTGGHEGGMLAGLYDTQFNFSDEIGDSFYFYGDRPLEFLGEHPWLTEHTEPAVENP
jgi:hypothetical protein